MLERDRRVAQLFIKYPDLEEELAAVEQASRPSVDDKLRAGWNSEVGKQNGIEALRIAKATHPGVEEFSELVTHLLSSCDEGEVSGSWPTLTASRADQEDIRRLMSLEGQ